MVERAPSPTLLQKEAQLHNASRVELSGMLEVLTHLELEWRDVVNAALTCAAWRDVLLPHFVPLFFKRELRKNKKKIVDPSAPKKPRTPYFAFLDDAKTKNPGRKMTQAWCEELTAEWCSLPEEDKKKWSTLFYIQKQVRAREMRRYMKATM